MSDKALATKVEEVLAAVEPNDTPPPGRTFKLIRDDLILVTELDRGGWGHTYLETIDEDGQPFRIEISGLVSGISLDSVPGHTVKARITMLAIPARVRAVIGELVLVDREMDGYEEASADER